MTSYFRPLTYFLDPKNYCRNYVEPGIKWQKHSKLCSRAKNWPGLKSNNSPLTKPPILRFESQTTKGGIFSAHKNIVPNSQFWLSYSMQKNVPKYTPRFLDIDVVFFLMRCNAQKLKKWLISRRESRWISDLLLVVPIQF